MTCRWLSQPHMGSPTRGETTTGAIGARATGEQTKPGLVESPNLEECGELGTHASLRQDGSPPPYKPVIYTHSHLRPSPGFAKPSQYRRTRSPSFAEGSEYSMCDTPQRTTPQLATPQPATPQLATPQPTTPAAESDVSFESWISEFDFEELSELMQDDDTGCPFATWPFATCC